MKQQFYYYWGILGCKSDFELGMTILTEGVKDLLYNDMSFAKEIDKCFERYIHKDLGLLGKKIEGECTYEVIDGEEIMGAYQTSKGQIYFSTSYDRKGTIIFLPEER